MSATRTRSWPAGVRPSSARGVVLWASLAANLFFAGLIGSHLLFHRPPPRPGLEGFIGRLTQSLPPADGQRFHEVLARERPWYEQAHTAMERARVRLAGAISHDPYDEDQVRERLQEWRARWSEGSDRFGDSLLVAIRTLSPEGRQRLAAALLEPRH